MLRPRAFASPTAEPERQQPLFQEIPVMNKLSGKTALVTGASRGIGRASALVLAKEGAQVLVHFSSSEQEADAVVAEIRKAGGKADMVSADLRQADRNHTLAQEVRAIVGDWLDHPRP